MRAGSEQPRAWLRARMAEASSARPLVVLGLSKRSVGTLGTHDRLSLVPACFKMTGLAELVACVVTVAAVSLAAIDFFQQLRESIRHPLLDDLVEHRVQGLAELVLHVSAEPATRFSHLNVGLHHRT